MTKAEIIAELRRSAVEDEDPYMDCLHGAWIGAEKLRTFYDVGEPEIERMFFLLVACALESE